jgi:hypothetical protein
MPVKDVYGKEVSEQNHMVFAHNPTSMLINELKNKKMSDGITEARRGTYWANEKYTSTDSINNPELYSQIKNKDNWQYKDTKVKKVKNYTPNQKWHRYVSFIKSGVRIVGYGLIPFNLVAATIVLIFSEIIGVVEELV